MQWLQNHAVEYSGSWVAVEEGQMVGTAASRRELVDKLGERADAANLLLVRIP
jgi:hypothetical protein